MKLSDERVAFIDFVAVIYRSYSCFKLELLGFNLDKLVPIPNPQSPEQMTEDTQKLIKTTIDV